MTRWLWVAVPVLLSGCVHELPRWGKCHADTVQGLIGQRYTPRLHGMLRNHSHAHEVRTLRPGDVTISDYRANRLTVSLTERGLISGLICG